MVPQHGADFSEQCRIAAACGAGVRITNEGSDYVHNLMLTRLVASAGQHHGAFYGFEPAAAVDAVGVAARQYNATASGARQLHEYQNNLIHTRDGQALPRPGAGEAWERGRDQLVRRVPRPHVALLHSLPDLALRQAGIAGDALRLARCLRPLCDFAVLDDHLVAAGALVGLQAVFLAPARLWAPTVLECLHAFAASGGLVIAAGPVPSVLGALAAADLFGFGPATEELAGIAAVLPVPEAPLPTVAAVPRQHLARGFRGLDPACRPLLRLAHTPKTGGIPLAAWYRPWGRGAAVFYAGQLAQGEDWMASAGMPAAFVADLLAHLPPALGLPAVPLATTPGVYETETSAGWLAWNATDAPRPWRGRQLDPWAIGAGSNAISGSDGTE